MVIIIKGVKICHMKSLKKLFIYEKPLEYDIEHGFELLEDADEGKEIDKKDKPVNTTNSNTKNKEYTDSDCAKKQTKIESTLTVSSDLNRNLSQLKKVFNLPENQDVVIRELSIARKFDAFIVFVDGMVDKNTINHFILPQLMDTKKFDSFDGNCPLDFIIKSVISINQVTKMKDYDKIQKQVLYGLTALFIDGCNESLVMETRGFEKRNVDNPKTEAVVKGSQEAFTENLRTNITLVRRIIKSEKLITEFLPVGKTNNSNCAVMFIEGIANPKVVKEVRKRIQSIDSDFVQGSGMLEQFIEDSPWMLLPQILSTERPDRTASFLVSGQVVIIVDGTPFALAAPVTFWGMFHTSEDSNLRWQYGTFLRIVRFVGLLLAASLPGLYLALELYHPEMLPTTLLAMIEKTRENVPFPAIIEIIMMEFSFELIREGGLRVPGLIGQTLGIIGALILGQAAVAAGLVSPMLIIIVSITGLGSFTIPSYELGVAIRILRFVYILAGSIAGFFGISVAFTVTAGFACAMKSFGVPFFSPVTPRTRVNPDIIIQQPIFKQKMRPDYLNTPDKKRQGSNPRGWATRQAKKKEEDGQ